MTSRAAQNALLNCKQDRKHMVHLQQQTLLHTPRVVTPYALAAAPAAAAAVACSKQRAGDGPVPQSV
jgi:hypothetical protein